MRSATKSNCGRSCRRGNGAPRPCKAPIRRQCGCGSSGASIRSKSSWKSSPAVCTPCRDTSHGKLKAMVDDEAAKGKDLIKDMVRRLKRDILVATNRLDALTH